MAAHRQTMPAMMLAEVPPGMCAGSQFIVRAPNGQQVMVTLSEGDKFHVRGRHLLGLSEGDKFHVAIPETTLIHSFVHPTRTDKVKVSTYGLVIGEHIKDELVELAAQLSAELSGSAAAAAAAQPSWTAREMAVQVLGKAAVETIHSEVDAELATPAEAAAAPAVTRTAEPDDEPFAVQFLLRPREVLAKRVAHDEMAELAAQLCDGDAAAAAQAEAVLAAHQPVPQWAVEGVLLSSDLVPHVLADLELEDGAAAAACSAWAAGWRATAEGRRKLKQVPFDFPHDLLGHSDLRMTVIPGEEERLVAYHGDMVRIQDRSMTIVSEFEHGGGSLAADEQSLFVVAQSSPGGHHEVRRLSHDGTTLATYEEEEKDLACLVLAPGGLLFCFAYNGDTEQDEIVAFDAQTLELSHRFGQSLLNFANDMAVAGEELFVCDTDNDRLQVFSLAGEHRRSITGEWKKPECLCVVKDRLYLVEEDSHGNEGEGRSGEMGGKRIFILSLQGDLLYTYAHPYGHYFGPLCCFDGKLLVGHGIAPHGTTQGVQALAGL